MENKLMRTRQKLPDILAIAALFFISLVFLHDIFGAGRLMDNGHHLHEQTFFGYNYKVAQEEGTLPFWTPYWYSGQPLYGDAQVFFLNLTHIFISLFKNVFLAIDMSTLVYLFISGLSMYFLVKYLTSSRVSAFISSLVYMFNGMIYGFVVTGNPSVLEPYSLIPFIFLFVVKSERSPNPVPYAILAGVMLALQVFSGGMFMLIYTLILIGLYLAASLLSKKFLGKFLKAFVIALVMFGVLIGLSAVKLWPGYDFSKLTNRSQGVSYQEYIGQDHFVFNEFIKNAVLDVPSGSVNYHIGILAAILLLCSLALLKKKMVAYLAAVSIFALFLASGGVLAGLFYKYVPVFSQTRHIGRVMFLFVFSSSVLAGYGFDYIHQFFKKIRILNKSRIPLFVIFMAVAALIFTELVLLKGFPQGFSISDQLEQNELAKYLQQQNEKFRITTFDVDDTISFYASSYYAQYGLETISGGGGVWFNDYVQYLAFAKNTNAPKLYGILNMKYATSTKEVDIPGFAKVRKFSDCAACNESDWTYWIAGPYLYENTEFLPRYYFVDNAILIAGDKNIARELAYRIIINPKFNPRNTVIVQGNNKKLEEYDPDFLQKFNAIILVKDAVGSDSIYALQKYINSGGKVLPDVLNGQNSLTLPEIEDLLGSFKGNLTEVDSKMISNNEVELTAKNKGHLVLSERFASFGDWKAELGNKNPEIFKSDGEISYVYADMPGKIRFNFFPKTFVKGLAVSLITLVIIFIYWAFFLYKAWSSKKKGL